MSACEKAGQWEAALWILHGLEKLTLRADVIIFNAAISACEKGTQWPRAVALLEDLQVRRLQPSVVSYNAAISACGAGGEAWQQGLHLLKELREIRLEATTISYNAAISACEIGDHWEMALALLDEMGSNLQANLVTFNALLRACSKGGQWSLVMRLIADMHRRGVHMDDISFSTVICSLEMSGNWQAALCFLFDAWATQRPSSIITANAAMAVCLRGRQWLQGLRVMTAARGRGLGASVITHELTLKAYELGRQRVDMLRTLSEVRTRVLTGGKEFGKGGHSLVGTDECESQPRGCTEQSNEQSKGHNKHLSRYCRALYALQNRLAGPSSSVCNGSCRRAAKTRRSSTRTEHKLRDSRRTR